MRKLAIKASGLSVLVALGALLGATPASAAPGVGVVELSDDGVNFARSYPGVIFDDIVHLTPGDSQTETIYVRNTGTAAGYLRVVLQDTRFSDQHFADSLTIKTSTPSSTGSATRISTANPCRATHDGTLVAPGDVVPVTATLALGNLNGADGQGATASLALRFTLSDSAPGAAPTTNCGTGGAIAPTAPAAPELPGSEESFTGAGFVPVPNPGSGTSGIMGDGTEIMPFFPSNFNLDPNTWRLYQEYLVLILVFAAIVGAGISWFAGRRSRKDTEDV